MQQTDISSMVNTRHYGSMTTNLYQGQSASDVTGDLNLWLQQVLENFDGAWSLTGPKNMGTAKADGTERSIEMNTAGGRLVS